MKLRGIEFGPCLDAAGVRGFFCEGYWFHTLFRILFFWGFSFKGSTFVAKTTTLAPRMAPPHGNMRLDGARPYWPLELLPRCIWFSWLTARTLNAVGLAGPGARALLEDGLLLRLDPAPFMISFGAVGATVADRLKEMREFITLLKGYLSPLIRVGLQINISCPNTGHDTRALVEEARAMLDIAAELGIPLVVKINLLAPLDAVKQIAEHPACDALCFTNAIPFGAEIKGIDWRAIFPAGSPLDDTGRKFGGGGYSGDELVLMVANYARNLRKMGVEKPFSVGGGVRSKVHVDTLVRVGGLKRGHDSIFSASIAMVRPWRLKSVANRAHEKLGSVEAVDAWPELRAISRPAA